MIERFIFSKCSEFRLLNSEYLNINTIYILLQIYYKIAVQQYIEIVSIQSTRPRQAWRCPKRTTYGAPVIALGKARVTKLQRETSELPTL